MTNRLALALQVLTRGVPGGRALARGGGVKQAPYLFPKFLNGQPTWIMSDFMAYVHEGFNLNAVIYAAVMYKARTISKARLRAYTGDRANPKLLPDTHPLQMLCMRPNAQQSWVEFQQQREIFLNIAGNSFTYLDRPTRDGIPTALYNLRPDRVRIVPGERDITGFLYMPENTTARVPILPRDMIHVKFPNPMDPLEGMGYGMSPMAPLAQSADVDNAVTAFLKLFFEHGAMTNGILKTKVNLSPTQVNTIRERWRETYGGFENWADVGVLDSDTEYQRIGLTFDEMGFETLDQRNEARMLGPFGVPPQLIYSPYGMERNTFSNAEEARKALWEDTLLPELNLFYEDDNYYLAKDGDFVMYDLSDIPALQVALGPKVDTAYKMWQMGMSANQAYAEVGLRFAAFLAGEASFVAGSLKTPEQIANPPAPPQLTPNPAGGSAAQDEGAGGNDEENAGDGATAVDEQRGTAATKAKVTVPK